MLLILLRLKSEKGNWVFHIVIEEQNIHCTVKKNTFWVAVQTVRCDIFASESLFWFN